MSPEHLRIYALLGVQPSPAPACAALEGQSRLPAQDPVAFAQALAGDPATVCAVARAMGVPLSMLLGPSASGQVSALSGSVSAGTLNTQPVLILAAAGIAPGPGVSSTGWPAVADVSGSALAADLDRTARSTAVVIDYDGQTATTATTGQKAVAAGWIHGASWVAGRGLVAEVVWTAAAEKLFSTKEYRYLQPQLQKGPDGNVSKVLFASLTNVPRRFAVPLF